jgi:lipopolysaccharide/colanic/teichoic acid biosynthesis glycosyltransferase
MNFRIPWIISRRRKIIGSTLDYLINIVLFNYIYFKELEIYPNKLVTFSLAIFWILVSYVLGRYIKTEKLSISSFIAAFLKIVFLYLLCNLIYLVINWGVPLVFYWDKIQFSNYLSRELSNLFIRASLYISILSLFVQYFFSIITYNIYNQKKVWIFYGKESKFKQISEEIENIKNDIILKRISLEENLDFIDPEKIKGIVIDDFNDIKDKNLDIIFKLKLKGVVVESFLTWVENEFHRMPTHIIDNKFQLLEKLKSIEDNYQLRAKRIGDFLVSLFLLLITSPLFILVSVLIFIEDRGPLFYSQQRTGLNGVKFNIIKFRSMKIDAEKDGIQWSKHTDPRVTRIGKIIRAMRIDELPQLLCVLKGTMSLIGPRPERPEIENQFLKNIPYYNCRYILRPGISGWAQVNYPYGASILDTSKKLSFDIYYISHFTILLDLLILFKTIKLVLNAKGSKPPINNLIEKTDHL